MASPVSMFYAVKKHRAAPLTLTGVRQGRSAVGTDNVTVESISSSDVVAAAVVAAADAPSISWYNMGLTVRTRTTYGEMKYVPGKQSCLPVHI